MPLRSILAALALWSLCASAAIPPYVPPLKMLKAFDEEGVPPFPGVLIHVAPGDEYTICLPRNMPRDYPGLDEELKAAVAVWGSYINRDIPVKIIKRKPDRLQSAVDRVRFKENCGEVDLMVAFKPMQGPRIGHSELDYRYSWTGSAQRKNITGIKHFHRWLYLKQPVSGEFEWRSWRQHFGNRDSARDMVKAMRARDRYVINTGISRLTLRTIVHEMGHIWGLCDQYRFKGDQYGNCDRHRAAFDRSGNMVMNWDSIMAGEPWVSNLFLRDTDVRGLRHIANRFSSGWGSNDYSSDQLPPVAPEPDFITFDGIWRDRDNPDLAAITLSLNVTEPVKIVAATYRDDYRRVIMTPVKLAQQSYRSYRYKLSRSLLGSADRLELSVLTQADGREVWKRTIKASQFP